MTLLSHTLKRIMNRAGWLAWIGFLAVSALPAGEPPAAKTLHQLDLTKINRALLKEPMYQSREPQYCLLVFGPKADVRVWVVLDGDALYVDRNGNGDLTDPDERMLPQFAHDRPKDRPEIEVMRSFIIFSGEKPASGKKITGPILSCLPEVRWFLVEQYLPRDEFRDDPRLERHWKQPFRVAVADEVGWEQDADLAFAAQAASAPIAHFLGPKQVTLRAPQVTELYRGEQANLTVQLTMPTPGVNALVKTYGVPEAIRPVAEIELPPGRPREPASKQRVELSEPC